MIGSLSWDEGIVDVVIHSEPGGPHPFRIIRAFRRTDLGTTGVRGAGTQVRPSRDLLP